MSAFKLERVAGFAPASRPREGRILLIEPHPRGAPGWDLASGLILRTDALYTLSYGSRETGAGTGIRIRTKTLATSRAALTPHPQEIGAKSPECADAYSSSGRYVFSLNRLGIGVPGWAPTSNLLLKRTRTGESQVLRWHSPRHTVIERHIKVRGEANPYDPVYTEHFERRRCFAWRTLRCKRTGQLVLAGV